MEKNTRRKPFTFVAAVDPKINLIVTVPINLPGLKVKTDFHTAYKCRGPFVRFPAFVVFDQDSPD